MTISNSISVVVPTKNEASFIEQVLEALIREKEQYDLIFDITVVDNGSTDETVQLTKNFPVNLINTNRGVSHARNVGAEQSKGEIIAFIDGDVVIRSGWSKAVTDLVERQGENWNRMVFGSAVEIPDQAVWIEKIWFKSTGERKQAHNHINSGNMLIARTFFNEIGGFDEKMSSSEDLDLCQRAKLNGGILLEDTAIAAVHLGFPKTLSAFMKRELWHGKGMLGSQGGLLNNKALMLSIYTLFIVILFLLSIFIYAYAAGILLLFFIISMAALAILLCKPTNLKTLVGATVLATAYALSRTLALILSILKI